MRKSLALLFSIMLIASSIAFAEGWDDFNDVDKAWDGQKSITNKEFEDAINVIEGNKKKKEAKATKRKIKKISGGGESLYSEMDPTKEINKMDDIKQKDDGILVNIPVKMIINGKTLEEGFYNIYAEKDTKDGKIYLEFYQSQYQVAKVEATETKDDFDEETLNFAKMIPYNDSFVKIIFGSLNFNAYAFVPYCQ